MKLDVVMDIILKISCFITIILYAGCGSYKESITSSGQDNTPPVWDNVIGIDKVITGDKTATIFWGTATDSESPPVQYLLFLDTDNYPWDQNPAIYNSNTPPALLNLENDITYWFAVRCRDSANPPNVDTNTNALSGVPKSNSLHTGWAKTWGGAETDWGMSVAIDDEDNIYVYGDFYDIVDFDPGPNINEQTAAGSSDIFLSKFNSNGELIWVKTWGITSMENATAVCVDPWGDIIVTGRFAAEVDFDPGPGYVFRKSNGSWDIFISKLDEIGNLRWVKTFGGSIVDCGIEVCSDRDGNIYLTGYINGPEVVKWGQMGSDVFLSKFERNGDLAWVKMWGGFGDDLGRDIICDKSSNIYVLGSFLYSIDLDSGPGEDFHTSSGSTDIFLSKYDSSGNYVWGVTCGGYHADRGGIAVLTSSDNIVVSGYTGLEHPIDPYLYESSFIVCFDSTGLRQWSKTWGPVEFLSRREDSVTVSGIAIDDHDNVYIGGNFKGKIDFNTGNGELIQISGTNSSYDGYVSKFNVDGDFEWTRFIQSQKTNTCGIRDLAVDSFGNIFSTGYFWGHYDFNPGLEVYERESVYGSDVFLWKLLPNGYFDP